MVWQVVYQWAPSLSTEFRRAHEKLNKVLTGVTEPEQRWKRCISDTDNAIGMAMGTLFVKSAFQGSTKDQVRKGDKHEYKLTNTCTSWRTRAWASTALTRTRARADEHERELTNTCTSWRTRARADEHEHKLTNTSTNSRTRAHEHEHELTNTSTSSRTRAQAHEHELTSTSSRTRAYEHKLTNTSTSSRARAQALAKARFKEAPRFR